VGVSAPARNSHKGFPMLSLRRTNKMKNENSIEETTEYEIYELLMELRSEK